MTLATTVVFATGAGDSDEAAADDCGVASNCGGLGGWRVILLATEPRSGGDPSDSEPVEDPVEPVGNQAPNRVGSMRDQALTVGGESATVDVASFFSDPDGDDLTYRASSSNDRIATATVSGSDVTVAPAAEGTATITVTATDPGGLTAEQTFAATVSAEEAADLVVESPAVDDAAPDPGGSVRFSATVRNRGNAVSVATTLRYYRSLNATISSSDTAVGTDAVAGLAAGANSTESISLTVPSDAGTYYYGACVDSVTGESDTTNNCSAGVEVEVSDGGGGGDSYCRDDDVIQSGSRCDLFSTTFYFEVESGGRGCLRAGGVTSCNGNSISARNWTVNGIRITLVASRNDDDSWTIDDVEPEPGE
ncbi:MAG: hypothetical protein OXI90_07925 [Gammaproteobacteria bacterium]|nr:hypothetical protein [Gammaproteobacteria bacterium]